MTKMQEAKNDNSSSQASEEKYSLELKPLVKGTGQGMKDRPEQSCRQLEKPRTKTEDTPFLNEPVRRRHWRSEKVHFDSLIGVCERTTILLMQWNVWLVFIYFIYIAPFCQGTQHNIHGSSHPRSLLFSNWSIALRVCVMSGHPVSFMSEWRFVCSFHTPLDRRLTSFQGKRHK